MLTPSEHPDLTIVVPAYEAHATIARTLDSVIAGGPDDLEIVVVDDGSPSRDQLEAVLAGYPGVVRVRHDRNQGMVAARNSGIDASTGRYVTILDADDTFVPDWRRTWERIRNSWPTGMHVCFSACRDPEGRPTVADPDYRGALTFADALREHHTGEYLPIFEGPYIRHRRYVDLGTRRSCGQVSYLRLLQDAPFWLTPDVLRIYNVARAGSVSARWGSPASAAESVRCLDELLALYGSDYRRLAPRQWRVLHLKQAVYSRLAGRRGWWRQWRAGARPSTAAEAGVALVMLVLGPRAVKAGVRLAKLLGLVKRYG